jgi:heme-degrading monooxygenase HmoA
MTIAGSEDTVSRSGTKNTECVIFIFWQSRRALAGGVQSPAHAKKRAQCNREVGPVWNALETGPRYCISSIKFRSEVVASDEVGDVGSSGISYNFSTKRDREA